jgi:hypothetical protein
MDRAGAESPHFEFPMGPWPGRAQSFHDPTQKFAAGGEAFAVALFYLLQGTGMSIADARTRGWLSNSPFPIIYHSLNSPACSCVSITLLATSSRFAGGAFCFAH